MQTPSEMAKDPLWEKRLEEFVERKVAERFDRLQASIDQALGQLRAAPAAALADRATIVVFSGDMDRLMAAFVIATGAAAMAMDVSMYFTFWGLTALKKTTRFAGKSLPEKLIATMLPSGPGQVGTSRLNMLGLGPVFFKMMMKKNHVETLPDLIALARELGVRLIACQMSMGVMGIKKEELIDGLTFGGVGTYLGDACDAKITLFI
jgi:peroxiredoxin family protein